MPRPKKNLEPATDPTVAPPVIPMNQPGRIVLHMEPWLDRCLGEVSARCRKTKEEMALECLKYHLDIYYPEGIYQEQQRG